MERQMAPHRALDAVDGEGAADSFIDGAERFVA